MNNPDTVLATATAQVEAARANPALRPEIAAFFDPATFTVTYVAHDPATKEAAIIDSVLDYDPNSGRTSTASADAVIDYITSHNLKVTWLLETHAHADHFSAAPYLQERLGGKIAIGADITKVQDVFGKLFNAGTEFERDGSQFDALFSDGDTFTIGTLPVTVMHVPGHTPACIAYVVGEAVFAPDPTGTAEDDGWLLSCTYDRADGRSDLVILDARDVAAGPIATVHAPRRMPFGFHANWFPADT